MTTVQPPVVDYQNPKHMETKKKRSAFGIVINLLLVMGSIFLLISLLLPTMCAPKERANRVKCASNLRQIGQALQLYNADHKSYPDDPLKLITLCDLSTEVFICPSTSDTASSSTNPSLKDHCSYIFLFQTHSANESAETIIAYENPKNHDNEGVNFLYNDGHVDWATKTFADYMISEITAGHNPARPQNRAPSTRPAAIKQ